MRLHIYLDYTTQAKMQEIRQKYKVSLSTIVDVCLNEMRFLFLEQNNTWKDKYLTPNLKHQTCVIVNRENKEKFKDICQLTENEISKIASNLCYIIANDYKEIKNHDEALKLKMTINNKLSQKREIYWDYNRTYRQHIRAQKQYRREYETE